MSKRFILHALLLAATGVHLGQPTVAQEFNLLPSTVTPYTPQAPNTSSAGPLVLPSVPALGSGLINDESSVSGTSAAAEGKQDAESNGEDKDDLDSLLDMADKDVGKLSSVNVTSNASAPSLATEVTTVGRQKSTIGRSPAAVFVISNEMIQRSGARSIPEALRMAPGVQVSKIDANKWAVSIRGSSGQFANKLLVQIDGRSVYTPLFGGVFWDVQDVLLEDVERIEVIRGPGASVWGANAVNGVINVITKNAADTQGMFAEVGGGTEETGFTSARYGWQTGGGANVRVYGKWTDRDNGFLPLDETHDDWQMGRVGFRSDKQTDAAGMFTIQGDAYTGAAGNENVLPNPLGPAPFIRSIASDSDLGGGNLLMRYTETISEDSDWSIQAYYDRTERHFKAIGFGEDRDTLDFDFQHRFRLFDNHSLIWGAAYRRTWDEFSSDPYSLTVTPAKRADDLYSLFVQDEIGLLPELLSLTVGAKFLHNDYTGFEFQPTARLLWTPTENHSIWTSYSRAVRTPSRTGHDLQLTTLPVAPGVYPQIRGSREFQSENLDAWEAGFRTQVTPDFSWDIAAFYFDYTDLQSATQGSPTAFPGIGQVVPVTFANNATGHSYGFEVSSNYELQSWWRLHGAYSFLREFDRQAELNVDNAPRNIVYTQSSFDLRRNTTFDVIGRYSDRLTGQDTPSYVTMDMRLAWTPNRNVQWAVVGRNLLDADHPEWGSDDLTGNVVTNVQREVYGVLTLRY